MSTLVTAPYSPDPTQGPLLVAPAAPIPMPTRTLHAQPPRVTSTGGDRSPAAILAAPRRHGSAGVPGPAAARPAAKPGKPSATKPDRPNRTLITPDHGGAAPTTGGPAIARPGTARPPATKPGTAKPPVSTPAATKPTATKPRPAPIGPAPYGPAHRRRRSRRWHGRSRRRGCWDWSPVRTDARSRRRSPAASRPSPNSPPSPNADAPQPAPPQPAPLGDIFSVMADENGRPTERA